MPYALYVEARILVVVKGSLWDFRKRDPAQKHPKARKQCRLHNPKALLPSSHRMQTNVNSKAVMSTVIKAPLHNSQDWPTAMSHLILTFTIVPPIP